MADIIDYLEWRGDIPFSVSPFNEIDGAVLSRLVYQRFELTGDIKGKSVEEAAEAVLSVPDIDRKVFTPRDLDLMKVISTTPRFSSLSVLDFSDVTGDELQFTALTLLERNTDTLLVFFRGTDGSLGGLKEDFNMSFMTTIEGQTRALGYFNYMKDLSKGRIIIGGHSKGGNYAVFCGSFTDEDTQKRISGIYNYDGPGFERSILDTDGYKRICPVVGTFVPQSSIVGMMLEHDEKYTIVHSTKSSIAQHNIYSWELKGTKFVYMESTTQSSRFIDLTLKGWLRNLDREKRGEFIDGVYTIMENSGIESIGELREGWLRNGINIVKSYRSLPEETRKTLSEGISVLVEASRDSLRELRK